MAAETARSLIAQARARLKDADVDGGARDARLLLMKATGCSHGALVADPDLVVDEAAARDFETLLARRLAHEPVSRIVGEREFYGRAFTVTAAVLDPRPDTETLIEAALPLLVPGMRVLDLGAGSGAIIVTLLAERPQVTGLAADFSSAALAVTADNARRHGVADRLRLVESDWFTAVAGEFGLIVSNPPYIPAADLAGLEPDVRLYDPHLALSGGGDGLTAYRQIASGAGRHLAAKGLVLVEIGAGQAAEVGAVFAASGLKLWGKWRDLGAHMRVLGFKQA